MPKVLVIGDLMLDKYIWGSADKLSPEAPVPVVRIDSESFSLGGACNVAHNLVALGAKVSLYGAIGEDKEGEILKSLLVEKGIEAHCLVSNRPTTTKIRVMAAKHQMLRIDRESVNNLEPKLYEKLLKDISRDIASYDAVVLSDYLKGVLERSLTQRLINLALGAGLPVLCDPKGEDYSKYKNATILTPNKKEALMATKIPIRDHESLKAALEALQRISLVKYPLITLSEEGLAFLEGDTMHKIPTIAKEVYDVSGAGDTVIAALAISLAKKQNLHEATTFANAAAAVVIAKLGSAVATLAEIKDFLTPRRVIKEASEKIVPSLDSIKDELKGKRIIFTNGCFDLLHAGHVAYLQSARKLGDLLIVGLNSDASVRRLKGRERPINNQEERALVLASLACVSFVIIFEDDTPTRLIEELRPDILVKGADYEGKEIAGAQYAKSLRLIELRPNCSTTSMVGRIKAGGHS